MRAELVVFTTSYFFNVFYFNSVEVAMDNVDIRMKEQKFIFLNLESEICNL